MPINEIAEDTVAIIADIIVVVIAEITDITTTMAKEIEDMEAITDTIRIEVPVIEIVVIEAMEEVAMRETSDTRKTGKPPR